MAENKPSRVEISYGEHFGKPVIWIRFPYNKALVDRFRHKFPRARWSISQKGWYLADTNFNRERLHLPPRDILDKILLHIHPINQDACQKYVETLKLKAYSPATIRTYTNEFGQLLKILNHHPVNELTAERLRGYFLFCINQLKLSENLLHSRINAVKFYFEQVLQQESFFMEIPRPKKASLLPKVLNNREIKKIFEVTDNNKHKLLLQLCYGMGLRVSEIVRLKIQDIDSGRMKVLIEAAKGKKDRYVNLPNYVLGILRTYYKQYKPAKYLFEGQDGQQYSVRSAQAVFKQAMRKAKINKTIGIHSLRHSYATHLMEYGTDIQFIQKLLGHKDIKTTQIYTHVGDRQLSNIKSPLDFL